MECLDSRRLTGPNLHLRGAGVIAEIVFEEKENPKLFCAHWLHFLIQGLETFNLSHEQVFTRLRKGWASVGFSAPIDRLYPAVELNEWAVSSAIARCNGESPVPLQDILTELQQQFDAAINPRLLALQYAATSQDVPFLWDDDWVSVGYGETAEVWAADALPSADVVQPAKHLHIPVAMVTGTNGKTTTSRMLTRILMASGLSVGSTSSDGICVNEALVEAGDWTGPGAARNLLRRKDVHAAVLETARGGLLRRGCGVDRCDVSIVTNISEDHLGDYGIQTVADMAQVKGLVGTIVHPEGARVLNADDHHALLLAGQGRGPIIWFSTQSAHPLIQNHCQAGGEAWFIRNKALVRRVGTVTQSVITIKDIPCTVKGAAHYNAMNALAAAAGASAMGVPVTTIAEALASFGEKPKDNPGRCERFQLKPFDLVIDFAHNPAGVRATLDLARTMMKESGYHRLCVTLGQAGDRTDEAIWALSQELLNAEPDQVLLREIPGYERGRKPGEIPAIMQQQLESMGFPSARIARCSDEVEALDKAAKWGQGEDLVVHLIHIEREPVQHWLNDHGAAPNHFN